MLGHSLFRALNCNCRALVGISFERCVKYHRHVGRWTFVNMVAHFLALVVVYGRDVLSTRAGRWGEGNLYGLLAGTNSKSHKNNSDKFSQLMYFGFYSLDFCS